MKKISTLFKKNPSDLGLVIPEFNPENEWVLENANHKAFRKYDGTACFIQSRAIDNDERGRTISHSIYKRYDVKKGKSIPVGAIPCQEADLITGHHPHWVKCDRSNPADKYHFEAFDKIVYLFGVDGSYELCGPKIQGNPEGFDSHVLIKHNEAEYFNLKELTFTNASFAFDYLKEFIASRNIEGIVFHEWTMFNPRMCKIRKSDFGIKR